MIIHETWATKLFSHVACPAQHSRHSHPGFPIIPSPHYCCCQLFAGAFPAFSIPSMWGAPRNSEQECWWCWLLKCQLLKWLVVIACDAGVKRSVNCLTVMLRIVLVIVLPVMLGLRAIKLTRPVGRVRGTNWWHRRSVCFAIKYGYNSWWLK